MPHSLSPPFFFSLQPPHLLSSSLSFSISLYLYLYKTGRHFGAGGDRGMAGHSFTVLHLCSGSRKDLADNACTSFYQHTAWLLALPACTFLSSPFGFPPLPHHLLPVLQWHVHFFLPLFPLLLLLLLSLFIPLPLRALCLLSPSLLHTTLLCMCSIYMA